MIKPLPTRRAFRPRVPFLFRSRARVPCAMFISGRSRSVGQLSHCSSKLFQPIIPARFRDSMSYLLSHSRFSTTGLFTPIPCPRQLRGPCNAFAAFLRSTRMNINRKANLHIVTGAWLICRTDCAPSFFPLPAL